MHCLFPEEHQRYGHLDFQKNFNSFERRTPEEAQEGSPHHYVELILIVYIFIVVIPPTISLSTTFTDHFLVRSLNISTIKSLLYF